ncbi:MAG: GH116 family glycosyl-hydrolase, partial [Candidatus Hydrogenedentota bacterium]
MEKSPAPRSAADTRSEFHGVPVGGVATGYIEFGPDACFRNVTINNNRFPETRIPWAENAFLAVRASTFDAPWTRILQTAVPSAFDAAGVEAQTLRRANLDWKPLFPTAHYKLVDTHAPISLDWQVFSPVLPYDSDAALLPAIYFVLDAKNISASPVRVSAMFNWENLRGRQREKTNSDRGTINAVAIDEVKKFVVVPAIDATTKLAYAGLTFAHGSPHAHNEDADYTVLSVLPKGGELSMTSWAPESTAETSEFWQQFLDEGSLGNTLSPSARAYCGASVQSIELAPGETQRFTFILTWYAPRYILNGQDIGNGYARRFRDSVDLVEYCAKHHAYFQRSVANWHDRLEQSSLPKWLSLMLINNNHVLTTNSIYTAEGKFALFESLDEPFAAPLDHALFVSLATLLFFPQFAHAELIRYLSGDAAETGDPHHHMGYGTPESPGRYPGEVVRADMPAIVILLAYRN